MLHILRLKKRKGKKACQEEWEKGCTYRYVAVVLEAHKKQRHDSFSSAAQSYGEGNRHLAGQS